MRGSKTTNEQDSAPDQEGRFWSAEPLMTGHRERIIREASRRVATARGELERLQIALRWNDRPTQRTDALAMAERLLEEAQDALQRLRRQPIGRVAEQAQKVALVHLQIRELLDHTARLMDHPFAE